MPGKPPPAAPFEDAFGPVETHTATRPPAAPGINESGDCSVCGHEPHKPDGCMVPTDFCECPPKLPPAAPVCDCVCHEPDYYTHVTSCSHCQQSVAPEGTSAERFIVRDKDAEIAALKTQIEGLKEGLANRTVDRDEAEADARLMAEELSSPYYVWNKRIDAELLAAVERWKPKP